jgi:hypothetical protein
MKCLRGQHPNRRQLAERLSLASDKTRKLLDWSPKRADIQDDTAFGLVRELIAPCLQLPRSTSWTCN